MRYSVFLPVSCVALAGFLVANQAVASQSATGASEQGRAIFVRSCAACHHDTALGNKAGPSMRGVFGRRAASVPGYAFSPALKASGIVWTQSQLDAWLKNPNKMVRGNRMVVAPPLTSAERASLIRYLKSLK